MSTQVRPKQTDFYLLDELLTNEQRAVRDKVRAFGEKEITPIINKYWEAAEFPFELIPKLATLNLAGGSIRGYGCPGIDSIAAGLMAAELAYADASVNTFFGVHSGLAMTSIAMLGSEEQKQKWLPAMARMEKIGAFGLTEPDNGSAAVNLETRANRDGESWVLNGAKRWIGNATFADVVIIWARDDEGHVGGFLLEKGTPGFKATKIEGKVSKRAVWQADILLENCRVPLDARLAKSRSFRDTALVLTATRFGVAWEALGHAMACYDIALAYCKTRKQFGKPIASFQMVQEKLVWMLAEITSEQLMLYRLSQLLDEGKMTAAQASLAKLTTTTKTRKIAADARDLLGGNGILLENHVARHFADMEAVYTYEGTGHVQTLVVGREITGISAIV